MREMALSRSASAPVALAMASSRSSAEPLLSSQARLRSAWSRLTVIRAWNSSACRLPMAWRSSVRRGWRAGCGVESGMGVEAGRRQPGVAGSGCNSSYSSSVKWTSTRCRRPGNRCGRWRPVRGCGTRRWRGWGRCSRRPPAVAQFGRLRSTAGLAPLYQILSPPALRSSAKATAYSVISFGLLVFETWSGRRGDYGSALGPTVMAWISPASAPSLSTTTSCTAKVPAPG
jgi:hypothetical protein